MKKRILFIINPISGGKDKGDFPGLAEKYLDPGLFIPEYVFTKSAGHAFDLALEAVRRETPVVVAVGGDGTINEVASAVENSETVMGIVPCGSGNGLALSLNISLNKRKAIEALNGMRCRKIDFGTLNGRKFFNMAGVGFDANISHKFATMSSRGFFGYVKTSITEVLQYKSHNYVIEIDGRTVERKAFMISIANSPQYGNNAYISPGALLNDGLLDVCIVAPFPLWTFPGLVWRMFTKSSYKSPYLEIIKGKNIRIVTDNDKMMIHLDGEPGEATKELSISVRPSSLSVLY